MVTIMKTPEQECVLIDYVSEEKSKDKKYNKHRLSVNTAPSSKMVLSKHYRMFKIDTSCSMGKKLMWDRINIIIS